MHTVQCHKQKKYKSEFSSVQELASVQCSYKVYQHIQKIREYLQVVRDMTVHA